MNSENSFKQIEHEDSNAVVSFNNGATFKVMRLMTYINSFFSKLVLSDLPKQFEQCNLGTPPTYKVDWNKSGVEAEFLEPKSGDWKKGKVRMRVILEFCPDEPEETKDNNSSDNSNSLDDIRQTIS